MHPYLEPLAERFAAKADAANAAAMRAYMKDVAPFFGVKTVERRALLKALLAEQGKATFAELPAIARSAFAQPEREWHYMAVDLLVMHAKKLGPEHLPLLEELITTKSWWDTVDALATNVVGVVLKRYPKEMPYWNERWVGSEDMWLVRTSILFPLKWRHETDQALLFGNIERHVGHTNFFILKAIGWALRQYGRTEPEAVRAFVATRKLSPLSAREALRSL
ncbi:MAG: DNA alkylation repair protein [Flavobacteriales bacterium]